MTTLEIVLLILCSTLVVIIGAFILISCNVSFEDRCKCYFKTFTEEDITSLLCLPSASSCGSTFRGILLEELLRRDKLYYIVETYKVIFTPKRVFADRDIMATEQYLLDNMMSSHISGEPDLCDFLLKTDWMGSPNNSEFLISKWAFAKRVLDVISSESSLDSRWQKVLVTLFHEEDFELSAGRLLLLYTDLDLLSEQDKAHLSTLIPNQAALNLKMLGDVTVRAKGKA